MDWSTEDGLVHRRRTGPQRMDWSTEDGLVHRGRTGPQRTDWSRGDGLVHRGRTGPQRTDWSTEDGLVQRGRTVLDITKHFNFTSRSQTKLKVDIRRDTVRPQLNSPGVNRELLNQSNVSVMPECRRGLGVPEPRSHLHHIRALQPEEETGEAYITPARLSQSHLCPTSRHFYTLIRTSEFCLKRSECVR
ncbi:hypothetical protein ABVT39_013634 [Epinephelus coioides]